MTIDKRISYQWGGPGPGGQGARGQATQNPGSVGSVGGGDGREQAAQREAARQVAALQAERQAAAQREMQATIAAAEKQQAESERMSNLAEARRKMTQPVDVHLPRGKIEPLGKIDPYQQSEVIDVGKGTILTDPWSTYDVQKKKKEIDEDRRVNQLVEARKLMTQPTTVQKAPFEGARTIDTYTNVDPYKMNYLNRDLPTTYKSESLLSPTIPNAPVTTGEGMIPGPIQGIIDRPTAPVTGDRIMDLAQRQRRTDLSRIALQTDKSLTDVSDPSRQGIMSSFADTGKRYAKSAAPYMALNALGLGAFNLPLGIAKALGFDPIGSLRAKFPRGTGTKTAFQPSEGGGDGRVQEQVLEQAPANVIEENIQKFSPEKLNMYKTARSELQGVIDSGTYQGRKLTPEEIQMLQEKSLEIQKLMEQYLVNPEELGLARGGIAGLRG